VVCRDEDRVEALRGGGVHATVGDPTDAETVRSLATDVKTVFVGSDDAATNKAALATAREVLPDAEIVTYLGWEPPAAVRRDLERGSDRVVDPERAIATRVVESATGQTATRCRKLKTALHGVSGRLAVLSHDNPDPDAIASAVALVRLAERFGVPATACYYGDISHQENRALVNLLNLDLRQLSPGDDLSEFGGYALVDHARPGINDGLPESVYPDVVVDHHPPRAPVEARFADLRSAVGATSTLLTTYLTALGLPLDATIATALLYGIRVDTDDFSREVAVEDFEAAATLWPHVDLAILEKVESPRIGGETIDVLARAIQRREMQDGVLVTYVGEIGRRDALSQAADRLLSMEGVGTSLVCGRSGGTAFVSARSRARDIDLGETLRTAYDRIGSAGGHADMAGAQIPLGIIGEVDDATTLDEAIQDVVTDRFFEAASDRPIDLSVSYGDLADDVPGDETHVEDRFSDAEDA
jgi:nanoRNase/pAp phosphatase (c-di-AMP/oligoRNAs hydrolase)